MTDTLTGGVDMGLPEPEPADTGSLSDHEAQFHSGAPAAVAEAPETDATEDDDAEPATPIADDTRDDKGRFVKPERHRAKSQQAGAEDVETIAALTKRIKDAEAADGADIAKQDGESERVYTLRRRAELAERRRTAKAEPVPAPQRVAPAEPVKAADAPKKPVVTDFDNYEEFVEKLGEWTADRRWEAREAERVKQNREAEVRAESQRIQTSWQTKTAAAKAKYPDFQAIALDAPTRIPAGSLTDAFILEDEAGADVLYHLQRHGDELTALLSKAPFQQVKALSLLAQRLTTTTTSAAADTTGAAPRAVSHPAPKPPTPVRSGPIRTADEPPDPETSSLKDHERFFHKKH